MERNSTLQLTWIGMLHGRPIRVEEHRNDLSYIVEYYDESDAGRGQCIELDIEDSTELMSAMQQEHGQALM